MRCERVVAVIAGLALVGAAPGALAHSFGAAVTGFGDLALDADNRKDQYGSQAIAWRAIHGRARPSRSRIRRKFNDGAHVPFFLVAARARSGRRHALFRTERG